MEAIVRTPRPLTKRGVAAAMVVWTAALLVWRALHGDARAPLIAVGVALDLTLTAALAAYVFSRSRRVALTTAAIGLTLATIFVPSVRRVELLIEPALLAFTLARFPRARRVYRARRLAGDDASPALAAALGEGAGSVLFGRVMAAELTMLGLAFSGWLRRSPREGFFAHRKTPWLVILSLLMFLVAGESVAVHLLIMQLSIMAAWIVTLLTVYSLLWLIGDYHALRLHPTTIEAGELRVRVGLRWSARIALSSLKTPGAVERVESLPPDCLRATVIGPPNIVLRVAGIAVGPFGIERAFSAIGLALDEPEKFLAALAT